MANDDQDKTGQEDTEDKDGGEGQEPKESSQPSEPEKAAEEAKPAEPSAPSQPSQSSEPEKKEVKVSANLAKIIELIEKLSVLELSELVHALEDKFGVSAAPTMAAGAPAGGAAPSGEPAEEQTTFNVILSDAGANKISVIKAVREIVPTLGLTEAKALVDTAPKPVLEGVGKDAANEAKTKLEAAGAKVELQ